jgi:RNA polymerase sigma-70 factor (ECF subfamily)
MTSLLARRTDDQLVAAVHAGDHDAAGELARRLRPDLVATAARALTGTSLDAEDAVQDVLAKLPRVLGTPERPVLLRPWMRAVVRNRCLDLRRAYRPLVALPPQLLGPATTDPAVVAEHRQDVLRVVGALGMLPERQRRALVMHAVDGRPQAEIALALGTTVPAAKALVCRSRQALRATTRSGGFIA